MLERISRVYRKGINTKFNPGSGVSTEDDAENAAKRRKLRSLQRYRKNDELP